MYEHHTLRSVCPDLWPQNKCRSLWPIIYGPVIFPFILKTVWCMNIIIWLMSQYDPIFDLTINVGLCDLYFMVQWFFLLFWRLFDVWTSLCEIMSQYDPTCDLKITIGHCDLHFMIEWLCLIFPRLFDVWVSYFQILRQYYPNFDIKSNIGQHDLYFMV